MADVDVLLRGRSRVRIRRPPAPGQAAGVLDGARADTVGTIIDELIDAAVDALLGWLPDGPRSW